MNAISLVSLVATLVCLGLGLWVVYYNRKPLLNRVFFLVVVTGVIYSFTTVMMWGSGTAQEAVFWNKAGAMWPFFVASSLNFALVFTDNKLMKHKLSYLLLYGPAAVFTVVDFSTDLINTAPVMKYWGFNDQASGTWVYGLSTFWTAMLPLVAFGLCLAYYYHNKEPLQKKMAGNVAAGLAIPIVAFVVTNILTRTLNVDFPNLGPLSTLFFSVFVGYAIVKYGLFTIDSNLAADNIVSTIPDSLILANMDSSMMRVNERLVEFSGYSQGELLHESISKLFVLDQEKWDSIYQELIQNKVVRNVELTLKTKGSEERIVFFSGSVVKTRSGREVGLTCVIHDITARKRREEELANTKNYLETLVDSMLSAIVIIDGQTHRIVDVNKAALKMLDASRDEVVDRVCHQFMCEAQEGNCPITDLGLEVDDDEKVLWTLRGQKKYIIKNVAELQVKGRLLLIENFIDVSQRKAVEKELLRAQRLASIGELAGQLGHDLRNPLAGIKNGVYLVRKKGNQISAEKRAEILSVVDAAVEDSNRIVTSLVDFSFEPNLETQSAQPKSLVEAALLKVNVPPHIIVGNEVEDAIEVFVDSSRIVDVFARILQNSIQSIEKDGEIQIQSSVKDSYVTIEFADTGVGIPKHVLSKLFTPLVTTKAKGMGLGLAICKRIIDAHGGKISANNNEGCGAKISVSLPLTPKLEVASALEVQTASL